MQFVPGGSNHAAEVETLVQERQCLALGAFVGLFLADENFNLAGKESADGGALLGGEDFGFPNRSAVKADGDVLLEAVSRSHRITPRIIRVTRFVRACQ